MRIRKSSFWLPAALSLCTAGCGSDSGENTAGTSAAPPASTQPATTDAPPPVADARGSGPTTATAGTGPAASGAETYKTYCVTCHGPEGGGDGPASAALNPRPASFATGDFRLDPNGNGTKGEIEDIVAVVRDGAAKHGGSPLMTPWPMLSPEQMQAVAEHVKSLGGS
jgi:mono/diheme cytochrome c family protein